MIHHGLVLRSALLAATSLAGLAATQPALAQSGSMPAANPTITAAATLQAAPAAAQAADQTSDNAIIVTGIRGIAATRDQHRSAMPFLSSIPFLPKISASFPT